MEQHNLPLPEGEPTMRATIGGRERGAELVPWTPDLQWSQMYQGAEPTELEILEISEHPLAIAEIWLSDNQCLVCEFDGRSLMQAGDAIRFPDPEHDQRIDSQARLYLVGIHHQVLHRFLEHWSVPIQLSPPAYGPQLAVVDPARF